MRKNELKAHTTDIIRLYLEEGLSSPVIAARYGCSAEGVQRVLSRNGVKCRDKGHHNRRYTLDETYFDTIDTAAKAYWLGLLYADGYNRASKGTLVLCLQERDRQLTERLNDALGSNRPIVVLPRRQPQHQEQVRLLVVNRRLSRSLVRQGMTQGKSLTLAFPTPDQVPPHLLRHFVRGYFDGDGCICLSKGRATHPTLAICVTRPFGEALQQLVAPLDVSLCFAKPQSNIYKLHMGGRRQCLRLMDWMYTDAEGLYLDRKHSIYMSMKGYSDRRYSVVTP
jgi:hypothetical protein